MNGSSAPFKRAKIAYTENCDESKLDDYFLPYFHSFSIMCKTASLKFWAFKQSENVPSQFHFNVVFSFVARLHLKICHKFNYRFPSSKTFVLTGIHLFVFLSFSLWGLIFPEKVHHIPFECENGTVGLNFKLPY